MDWPEDEDDDQGIERRVVAKRLAKRDEFPARRGHVFHRLSTLSSSGCLRLDGSGIIVDLPDEPDLHGRRRFDRPGIGRWAHDSGQHG